MSEPVDVPKGGGFPEPAPDVPGGHGRSRKPADVSGEGQASSDPIRDPEAGGSLRGAQRRVDEWISQFEEGYWPPLAMLARLMEEVGELARLVNHRFGTKPKKPDEGEQELSEELADVLFVILCMANEQGIDLEEAFGRVLEKYQARNGDRWERKVEPGEA